MSRSNRFVRPWLGFPFQLAAVCAFTLARAATFTVNSNQDSPDANPGNGVCADGVGFCTLRAAIAECNATGAPDVIAFNVAGGGTVTIRPGTALPAFTAPVTIDGFTQPGALPNTNPFGTGSNAGLRIELDGSLLGPFTDLLVMNAPGNTVRGLVINRAPRIPIALNSSNNVIEGNYIGTTVTGSAAATNGLSLSLSTTGNRIGGSSPGSRNVIAASNSVGIRLGSSASGNQIIGNFIGTNAAGTAALPHQFDGIDVRGSGNTIRQNLISGNGSFGGSGILCGVFGPGSNNVIEGNFIGTNVNGTLPIPNRRLGIDLRGGASFNKVGGGVPGEGNLIAFNAEGGIGLFPEVGETPLSNAISGNSIHSNTGLGIDLYEDGVTANDAGDGDVGANGVQNFPVLASAFGGSGLMQVSGTLESQPGSAYRLEFFSSPACDPTQYGEGAAYLGSCNVTTDGGGNAGFACVLSASPAVGSFITATATDAAGNTSEFSRCVQMQMGTGGRGLTWGELKAIYR